MILRVWFPLVYFNRGEFKSLRQPRFVYFSIEGWPCCLCYQFFVMLLHCAIFNRNIPYPLGTSLWLPSLGYRTLRMLLVQHSIHRISQVHPIPSLLNTFPDLLLSSSLAAYTLVCFRVLMEAGAWKRATSALRLTPVCWVPTALDFSPAHCLSIALGFSLVRCVIVALGLTHVYCEVGAHCPLVASFLFVLADAEPYKECSS